MMRSGKSNWSVVRLTMSCNSIIFRPVVFALRFLLVFSSSMMWAMINAPVPPPATICVPSCDQWMLYREPTIGSLNLVLLYDHWREKFDLILEFLRMLNYLRQWNDTISAYWSRRQPTIVLLDRIQQLWCCDLRWNWHKSTILGCPILCIDNRHHPMPDTDSHSTNPNRAHYPRGLATEKEVEIIE